jgi:TolB-like protein
MKLNNYPFALSIIFLSLFIMIPLAAKNTFAGKETLSILYFDNITKDKEYDWLSKGIADMLITEIAQMGAVNVVERSSLKKIMEELSLSQSDMVDEKKALRIGKLASASKLVYGSYIIQEKSVVINGKITETESGVIISTFSVSGPVDSVLSLQHGLAIKAKEGLGIKESAPAGAAPEYSFEAVKNYYQGLDLLDKGAVEDARKKFEEASRIDPYYLKPYQGIEESYKFLKNFTKMRQQREIADLYDKINKIQARLKEKPWRTFADIAMDPRYNDLRTNEKAKFDKEFYAYYQGDSPAVLTWNLQNNLRDLADLYEEYFEDTARAVKLYKEVISITDRSRKIFARDPFFPEVLYAAVLANSNLENWQELKQRCEELMTDFPEYRMMWAVEDFYKRSLEKISGKEE